MPNKMKLGLIILAFAMLALSSIACDDPITPGDGKVADAVTDADAAIRNTATDVKELVESTGESSVEIPTEHGTIVINTFWDIAFDILKGE